MAKIEELKNYMESAGENDALASIDVSYAYGKMP